MQRATAGSTWGGAVIVMVVLAMTTAVGTAYAPLPPREGSPSRADLAAAYIEVDRVATAFLARHAGDGVRIAEANRRFDLATGQFFLGQPMTVLETLRELVEWMEADRIDDPAQRLLDPMRRLLDGLRVTATPSVLGPEDDAPTLRLTRLYSLEWPYGREVTLVISARQPTAEMGDKVTELCRFPAGSTQKWPLDADAIDRTLPGRCDIEATIEDAGGGVLLGPRRIGRLAILDENPDSAREALTKHAGLAERLAALQSVADRSDGDALKQALASFRARLELLVPEPSQSKSAQFLAEPFALHESLRNELSRLLSGANPYAEGHGDWWRVFEVGAPAAPVRIPARVIVPESIRDGAMLVIALHGAGGDENMFPDGYGAGIITSLAADLGAVIVTPSTSAIAFAPGVLTTIIETLVAERRIDPKRVVILGHSMGAAAAMRAVDALPGTFAAWAAIGGVGALPKDRSAAGLIVLGELDPLANPASLLPTLRPHADEAGVRIEVIEDAGHTLIVGEVLVDVMSWLEQVARPVVAPPVRPPLR